MSIVLNFLIAAAGIGGFAGICALSQKARMQLGLDVPSEAMAGFFEDLLAACDLANRVEVGSCIELLEFRNQPGQECGRSGCPAILPALTGTAATARRPGHRRRQSRRGRRRNSRSSR